MKAQSGFLGKIVGKITSATSEEREKLEQELPFVVMIFTLLSAGGVSPYDSWKKMRKLSFLPTFRKEADEVIRQVEILGKDPLTVLHQRAEVTKSKLYRNFLGGFVSSVRSGGKLVNFLRSELKVIFELRNNAMTRSIEKIATLVEAYTVMLIVVLCTYILFVVFSSTSVIDILSASSLPISPVMSYLIAFIFMPVLSLIFIMLAHNMQKSSFVDLSQLYKKAVVLVVPVLALVFSLVMFPSMFDSLAPIGLPEIATLALVVGSLIPAVQYRRVAKVNYNAEDSIPHFIRDVTEANKIGLSPEKSLIQAAKRKGYGGFSKFLELLRSQLEWGVPLRKTFANLSKEIKSWFVMLNFAMMIETIEIGGNATPSLEILSEYSEKERELQINKRALLRPYIMLAVIWSVLIAVTTTIVAITTYMMSSVVGSSLSSVAFMAMQSQMRIFSVGIILQCWISGFFIGKISEGNFGAGFQYSALLAGVAYVSLVLSQQLLSGMFGLSPMMS
ncbi:MAG: type II secretion system F family protein [Candidatus Bathyarchaeota archaeon]|nr:type II secretion system F family protein [Candidatus Bathyarchaeota archaeon]